MPYFCTIKTALISEKKGSKYEFVLTTSIIMTIAQARKYFSQYVGSYL